VYGFVLIAAICATFAAVYQWSPSSKNLQFVLLCVLTFALHSGPIIGIYVVPAICFPVHASSTCHGIAAMSGKLGAVVGTLLFQPLSNASLPLIFLCQMVVSLLGAAVSQVYLRYDWEYVKSVQDMAHQSADC